MNLPALIASPRTHRTLVALLVVVMLPLAWTHRTDELALQNIDTGLKRALVTFALARTANGLISVIQETTVGVSVFVGVTVSPGQILDPLNDLVEEFSTLMLAASVSFGIQRIFVTLGSSTPVAIMLTVLLLLYGWAAWTRRQAPLAVRRLLILAILFRFAVPMASLASEAVFQHFMQADLDRSQQQLQAGTDPQAWSDLTTLERLKSADWRHPTVALDALKAKAEALVEHIVRLITVFLVQTLVLPLLFIWLLQRVLSALLASREPRFAR
jgi:hypothetical protein